SQSYQSLKDKEFVEKRVEVETECFHGNTTMHGPIHTKLSELSLLDDSFSNQQEKTAYSLHTMNSTHNSGQCLEELNLVCKPVEQHGNISYQ
ncbi:DENN domain-containing protein 1A isoform X3, partial [Clarias magur]